MIVNDESFLHDKVFVLKTVFCKNSYIFLKMSELEIFLWLTQASNTSMQISRK